MWHLSDYVTPMPKHLYAISYLASKPVCNHLNSPNHGGKPDFLLATIKQCHSDKTRWLVLRNSYMQKYETLEPHRLNSEFSYTLPFLSLQSYSLPTKFSSTLFSSATDILRNSKHYITNPLPQLHSSIPLTFLSAWQPSCTCLSCPVFTTNQEVFM